MGFCVLLLALAILRSSYVIGSPTNAGNFELLILHNNDLHARFEETSQSGFMCKDADRDAGTCYGGFPRAATIIKAARNAEESGDGPPVLYLNAGDTYTGTVWFSTYKWKIVAEFINALRPDAMSLGNHEFDESVEDLALFINNVTSTPVLAANLILDKVPVLQNETNLYKHFVLTKNNIKIGIIGYLTPDTKNLARQNNVEYEEEIQAIQREVDILKSLGIKILIALGHSGFMKDVEIAEKVKDIDLVVGGHTNTFLWNGYTNEKPEVLEGPYPTVITQSSGRRVPVVQAYHNSKYIGKLHLIFNSDGEVINYTGNPILLDKNVKQDSEVLKIVNKYKPTVDRITNEVIGSSCTFLDDACRLKECNMGNLVNDALLQYIKQANTTLISVIQSGRIRASIDHTDKPFQLTKGDVYTALPYLDKLTIVSMNGSTLLKALEHSVASWRTVNSKGQFLQVGGINVTYDLARPPYSRVVKAFARCSTCFEDPSEIRNNFEYKVIMPSFLIEGGDGFVMFINLPNELLDESEAKYVIDYIRNHSPVNPKENGRITILNEDLVQILNT